jgi:hypothetical protein
MTPLLATTCQFLDVDVSLSRGKFNMRVYDKSDNIYFPIVNFPFLDGDVPLAPSDIMWCLPLSHVISFCTYMFKFCSVDWTNRICGIMVSVLASSAVDRGFELRSGQIKDYVLLLR